MIDSTTEQQVRDQDAQSERQSGCGLWCITLFFFYPSIAYPPVKYLQYLYYQEHIDNQGILHLAALLGIPALLVSLFVLVFVVPFVSVAFYYRRYYFGIAWIIATLLMFQVFGQFLPD